jgi:hypothetical protein
MFNKFESVVLAVLVTIIIGMFVTGWIYSDSKQCIQAQIDNIYQLDWNEKYSGGCKVKITIDGEPALVSINEYLNMISNITERDK